MQALSHYSYHITGGQFLMCDLQGGWYSDGVILVLSSLNIAAISFVKLIGENRLSIGEKNSMINLH